MQQSEIRISRRGAQDRKGTIEVQIWGATTALSTGYATFGYSTDAIVDRNGRPRIAPPVIEITSGFKESYDFCAKGDSGALVVTTSETGAPRPLGVLLARSKDPKKFGAVGYAVPIQRVLEAIGPDVRIDSG